ncbi:UNVERIFIED_CONTAM: hypothetical protein GTU68_023704 [Idotea baltica]|nr:hypothetical protein [Idotea baltica]
MIWGCKMLDSWAASISRRPISMHWPRKASFSMRLICIQRVRLHGPPF